MTDETVIPADAVGKLPPDWAIERAIAEFNETHPGARWTVERLKENSDRSTLGFVKLAMRLAKYIAEHEAPPPLPVDPCAQIVRDIIADEFAARKNKESYVQYWRDGCYDKDAEFAMVMTALKRGMEMAGNA